MRFFLYSLKKVRPIINLDDRIIYILQLCSRAIAVNYIENVPYSLIQTTHTYQPSRNIGYVTKNVFNKPLQQVKHSKRVAASDYNKCTKLN